MTEANPLRPVPGAPRPGPWGGLAPVPAATGTGGTQTADAGAEQAGPFAGLDRRPVTEHVAVFEAEHARLQRELGTIDQL